MNVQISEEQFFDYISCPVSYDVIHNRKIMDKPKASYNKLLRKVWEKFSTQLMDGKVMTIAQIKHDWDVCCEQYPDIISPAKSLEGLGLLMKMYNWAESEKLMIADKNVGYKLLFENGNDSVEITGSTGILAMNNKNVMYLLDMDFTAKYPEQSIIDAKLKYSLDIYAIQRLYNKKVGVKVHHVKNDKDFYSMRSREDFQRLETAIMGVGLSIGHGLYYPRENAFCRSCTMLHLCKAWN